MAPEHPFHLAVPVRDLVEAQAFYEMLGGRAAVHEDHAIIWDFYGHQIVTHVVPGFQGLDAGSNRVDARNVPVPHFGLVLSVPAWQDLRERLEAAETDFIIKPHQRYKGTTGEQWTMFLRDPTGNALEFKAFEDPRRMFER